MLDGGQLSDRLPDSLKEAGAEVAMVVCRGVGFGALLWPELAVVSDWLE